MINTSFTCALAQHTAGTNCFGWVGQNDSLV